MSILTWLLRRLGRGSIHPSTTTFCPDALKLRDWADLPPHHPR